MEKTMKLISKEDKELFRKIKTDIVDKARQREIDNNNEYWEMFENSFVEDTILELRKLFKFDDEVIYELFKIYAERFRLEPFMTEKLVVFCKMLDIKNIEDLRKNKEILENALIMLLRY